MRGGRALILWAGLSAVCSGRLVSSELAFCPQFSRHSISCSPYSANSFTSRKIHCSSEGRLRIPICQNRMSLGDGSGNSAHDVAAKEARLLYSAQDDLLAASAWKKLQMDFILVRSYLKLDNRFNQRTSKEKSLLVAVVETGRVDLMKALLDMGASANERDHMGRTALMVACASPKGCESTVDLLLQHGADIYARDGHGDTAINYAQRAGKHAIVQKLRRSSVELHHLYSTPHFKAFLWLNGADMLSAPQPQVLEKIARTNIALCKMNIEMISINAALRLDDSLASTASPL